MTEWPTTLPLPFIDTAGEPSPANIVSPAETASIARRRRYTASVNRLQVQWVFKLDQYETFQSFFTTDLGMGTALFTIELKYPYTTNLTEWKVRLVSGYTASYIEGMWSIQGELELVAEVTDMSVPAEPEDWVPFEVVDTEAGSVAFHDADGNPFYVHV